MSHRILIVDDSEDMLALMVRGLESRGYQVKVCRRAEEAMESLRAWKPDLVILDIAMPEMDGITLLQWIREQDRDLPIIMCTAYEHYRQDFNVWASEAYIVKSGRVVEEVAAKIEELLERGVE